MGGQLAPISRFSPQKSKKIRWSWPVEVLPWICNLCQKKTKCCLLESKWKINYDLLLESCALTLHSSFTYKRRDLVSKEEEKTIHVHEANQMCFTAFHTSISRTSGFDQPDVREIDCSTETSCSFKQVKSLNINFTWRDLTISSIFWVTFPGQLECL